MMNPRGRLVSPRRFLPAAQRYNLAPDIDLWVLHSVLLWLEQNPGTRHLSVNLSGRTLGDPGALAAIAILVESQPEVAQRLGFEVTESATIGHLRSAREFMLRVTATGARFALDDFGMGLSSFAYLEQLPVRALKIDKHFVRGARGSVAKRAILNAFSDIGRALGLDTVGEGVEDAETLALLAGAGVQYAQGYFVGRPAQLAGLATVREADQSKVVPLRVAPMQERRKQ
jgi:Amt family ammonium transporter